MISFKKYTLLKEAFQVPYNVIQPILDYYYESYKNFLKIGREKVTPKLFPEKNFKLDFSGTRYEFLNELKPNVNVYFLNNKHIGSTAYFWELDKNKVNTFDKTNTGNIYINFAARFEPMYYGTIEHEVLHYLQYLIKKYKKIKKKKEDDYGGLPSKKIIPSGMTTRGKVKEKRTHHEYRPIEYYTNLMSAIRSLERTYEREMLKEPATYEKSIKDKKSKKEFLEYTLKAVRQNKGGTTDFYRVLSKIRNFSPEIYKKYLQIIYKVFVEGEPAYNLADVKKLAQDIEEAKLEGKEAKKEKKEQELTKAIVWRPSWRDNNLRFLSYDTSNIFDKAKVNIYDGMTISGEYLLLDIGASEKNVQDDTIFFLPRNKSNIVTLFKNLNTLKRRKQDYELRVGETDNLRSPNDEEIVKIYDAVFEELKERYLAAAEDQSKSHLSDLIDVAYYSNK